MKPHPSTLARPTVTLTYRYHDGHEQQTAHAGYRDTDPLAPRVSPAGLSLEPVVVIRTPQMSQAWRQHIRTECHKLYPCRNVFLVPAGVAEVTVGYRDGSRCVRYAIQPLTGGIVRDIVHPDSGNRYQVEYLANVPWNPRVAALQALDDLEAEGSEWESARQITAAANVTFGLRDTGRKMFTPGGQPMPDSREMLHILHWSCRLARAVPVREAQETPTRAKATTATAKTKGRRRQ